MLGCLLVLLLALQWEITPVITGVRYSLGSGQEIHEVEGGLPIGFDRRDDLLTVFFTVKQSLWHPSVFTVRADDCLRNLTINGLSVPADVLGSCEVDTPRDLRLGSYFRSGTNHVVAVIPDTGGRQGFSMRVSNADPLLLTVRLITALVFILLTLLLTFRRLKKENRWFTFILLVGVLIRFLYFEVTPFTVRSYDADGHLDYIRYIAEHHSIPLIRDGWQFYQPPLYYALVAPLYSFAEFVQSQHAVSVRVIQLFSVFLSILTLGICLWIARILFSKKQRSERFLFVAFFAVFSGVILNSVRVNNDILVQLLGFLSVALCLRFWQSGSARYWYLLTLAVSLGILTKNNALLFLPVALAILFLQKDVKLRPKILMLFLGLCILLSLTEWLFALRLAQDANVDLVGNVGNLNSGLRIPNTLSAYFTFNPFQILSHPYNDAFNDEARRMFFPEYLYRSAFFGEFNFGASLRAFSRWMLGFGFGVCVLSACGFFTELRRSWRTAMPLWLIFLALLLGHALFRFKYPYASSQDFRYSLVLLLPVAYFTLSIVSRCTGLFRKMLLGFLCLFVFLCGAYTVALSVINPL